MMREWDRVRVEAVERDAVGPEGQHAVLTDNVMVLRRSCLLSVRVLECGHERA